MITTNRGVAHWGDILGDTTVAAAMLDRLLHRSVVINLDGDSYRLREATNARTDTLRRTTTGNRTRYLDHASQVGNFDEHTWGTSASAIRDAHREVGERSSGSRGGFSSSNSQRCL